MTSSAPHPLKTPWRFSFQAYGPWEMTDTSIVCTVEQFWTGFEHLPTPSVAFRVTDGYARPVYKHGVDRVRSLCLRRNNIAVLEWEDRRNKGMYRCDVANMDKESIDELWETVCLGCVGETFGDAANAVRIIDRGKKQTTNTRVEIWCRQEDPNIAQALAEHVCVNVPFEFVWMNFETINT